jgi:hypothetical protein
MTIFGGAGKEAGTEAVDKLTKETLPLADRLLDEDLRELVNELHALLDRVGGITVNINFTIPPRRKIAL